MSKTNRQSIKTLYSIIICSFNEGRQLGLTIKNVLESVNFDDFELIVVDDGSTDNSTRFIQKKAFQKIKLYRTAHLGIAKARNFGATRARGKILIFADAHIRFEPGWLKRLDRLLCRRRQIKLLTGSINNYFSSIKKDDDYFYLYTNTDIAMSKAFFLKIKKQKRLLKVPFANASCLVIYKDVFNKIGGFLDFFLWGIEDRFLSMVAYYLGYDIYLDTNFNIYHNLKWSFRNIKTKIKKNSLKNSLFACYLLYPVKDYKDSLDYLRLIYPQLEKTAAYHFLLKNKARLNKIKHKLNKVGLRTYNDFVKKYCLFLPYLQINDYRKACRLIKKAPEKAYRLLLQARRLTYTNNLEETAKIMVDIKHKLQKIRKTFSKNNHGQP